MSQTYTYQQLFDEYTRCVATVNTLPYGSIEQQQMIAYINQLKTAMGAPQQNVQQQNVQTLSFGDMNQNHNNMNNVQHKNLNFGSNFSGHKMNSGVSGSINKSIKPNISGNQNNNTNTSPTETLTFDLPLNNNTQQENYQQQNNNVQKQQIVLKEPLKQKFPYLLDPINNEVIVGNEREVVGPFNIVETHVTNFDEMPEFNPLINVLKTTNNEHSLKENSFVVDCQDDIIIPSIFILHGTTPIVKGFDETIENIPKVLHSFVFNKLVKRFNGVLRAMENFEAASDIKSLKDIFKFSNSPMELTKNIKRYNDLIANTSIKKYDEENITINSSYAHVYYHTDFKLQGSHILYLSLESHATLYTLLRSTKKDYGILEGLDYCFSWYKGLDKFLLVKKI